MGTTGTATSTFSYAPYGTTTETTGTSNTPWRWTGQYYDTEGDNYYHQGARYNNTTGHLTQPDSITGTIATPTTLNTYLYADAGPINNTDPSGRFSFGDVVTGVGLGLGVAGLFTLAPEITLFAAVPAIGGFESGVAGATYQFGCDAEGGC